MGGHDRLNAPPKKARHSKHSLTSLLRGVLQYQESHEGAGGAEGGARITDQTRLRRPVHPGHIEGKREHSKQD